MAIARRRRWSGRPWQLGADSPSWTSRVISVAITLGVFAVAFVAMRTVRSLRIERPAQDAVAIVRLSPPRIDVPKPPPSRAPSPAPSVSPVMPVETPVTPERKPPTDTAAGAPVSSPGVPVAPGAGRDSGGAAVGTSAAAARFGTAGLVLHPDGFSAALRDSLAAARRPISMEEWTRPLDRNELNDVRARREPGLSPTSRAARLAGEPVYAPLMFGGSAVGVPVVSLPLGPSYAKKRKADSVIFSELQARLARFQQLILGRQRDSVRADSLRRDSLRRTAIRP